MAKSGKAKAKKNAAKNNGLVTSSSNNSKKKMYPEISMVCDFFCRYLINTNMFTLEQILNFKTNLRTILTKKYKQYTWDKRQPLKGNACRSILVLKSTLDPVLVVAGYKAGFLKMNEEDVNLKSEEEQHIISNLNTSINNFSNVITITPPPELDEDSMEESPKRLSFIESSPSLTAVRSNTLEKGQTISYEVFKSIFLKNGELVLWCDPGSVSYSLDDGQIVTLYDKEKEKAEHKKNKNHKANSPNAKSSSSHSPSPYLSNSESSNGKKSPLLLPPAAVPKKDKKKNKKKERKEDNNSNHSNSPSTKPKNSSNLKKNSPKTQSNRTSVNDILKSIDINDSIRLPPAYAAENKNLTINTSKHLSVSSIPSIFTNDDLLSPTIVNQQKFFNSLGRNKRVQENVVYSPELTSKKLLNRRDSFLSAIRNNEIVNNGNNNGRKNSINDNYTNKMMSQTSTATTRLSGNFSENHPFIGLLSRSAVIV